METDATFHIFKQSGKWYTSERGRFPSSVFLDFYHRAYAARRAVLDSHGGKMPGLASDGAEYTIVVIPDPDYTGPGWPIMLPAPRLDP